MSAPPFVVRTGGRHDLGMMADNLEQGFGSYRTWAAASWEPPTRTEMLLGMMQRFTKDGSWSAVAFTTDGRPAGHGAARPELDEQGARRTDVARLTHLFVRRDFWGSGVADLLHDRILADMVQRGFTSACLWTPSGQARARAFYERNAWTRSGAVDPENDLALELIEYVRELP
ncbi:MAG TPA: GNAT family N-acetyltransferase [Solirubrobacteraceae bacterium]|nr:GNAT family N-acetyltransferase [Solirubrobacteraceae bacterium]